MYKTIILLGFPKSGTTSLGEFFSFYGYTNIHFITKDKQLVGMKIKKNYNENRRLLEGIDIYDKNIITQMDCCYSEELSVWPQIEYYKQLYQENTNELFILNKLLTMYNVSLPAN